MGRAKYEEWLEKDNLILLNAWARDGLTDEQIAKNIGINPKTLYQWKKKYDPISKALKRGKEVVDYEVENTLLKKALGGFVVEEQTIEELNARGEMTTRKVKSKKYLPPDTTALIFWLKNRKPDIWMDRKAKEVSQDSNQMLVKYFELLDQEILDE
nr:MAG TPA: terminase small subunit [Caudoviricetes sp.]